MDYKGYRVEALGTFSLIQVKAKGSGQVPKALQGLYTSYLEAHKAVDMYLEGLKKGKSHGKKSETADSNTD